MQRQAYAKFGSRLNHLFKQKACFFPNLLSWVARQRTKRCRMLADIACHWNDLEVALFQDVDTIRIDWLRIYTIVFDKKHHGAKWNSTYSTTNKAKVTQLNEISDVGVFWRHHLLGVEQGFTKSTSTSYRLSYMRTPGSAEALAQKCSVHSNCDDGSFSQKWRALIFLLSHDTERSSSTVLLTNILPSFERNTNSFQKAYDLRLNNVTQRYTQEGKRKSPWKKKMSYPKEWPEAMFLTKPFGRKRRVKLFFSLFVLDRV